MLAGIGTENSRRWSSRRKRRFWHASVVENHSGRSDRGVLSLDRTGGVGCWRDHRRTVLPAVLRLSVLLPAVLLCTAADHRGCTAAGRSGGAGLSCSADGRPAGCRGAYAGGSCQRSGADIVEAE